MLVRMKTDISGLRDGKAWPPRGYTVELPEEEARDLIAADNAVEVDPSEVPVETAAEDTKPKQTRASGLTKASVAAGVEAAAVADAPKTERAAPKPAGVTKAAVVEDRPVAKPDAK